MANWTANAVIIASYLSVVETFGERNTFVMYAVSQYGSAASHLTPSPALTVRSTILI